MICKFCEKKIDNDSKFCQYCGKKIEKFKKTENNNESIVLSLNDLIKDFDYYITTNRLKSISQYSNIKDYDNFDTIKLGQYPQTDITGKNKEDVEWLVLKKENGRMLLISKYILDCNLYNFISSIEIGSWKKSTIREWLHNYLYYEMFSKEEQEHIIEVENKNQKAIDFREFFDDETTLDKIFFPSIQELQEIFQSELQEECWLYGEGWQLCAKPTNFAKQERKVVNTNEHKLELVTFDQGLIKGTSPYWLRDVVLERGFYTAYVAYNGSISYTSGLPRMECCGVRPCIWIKP